MPFNIGPRFSEVDLYSIHSVELFSLVFSLLLSIVQLPVRKLKSSFDEVTDGFTTSSPLLSIAALTILKSTGI